MELGFIGIGNMGAPMSANLARAGHEVTGFDLSPFNAEGVSSAASVSEAAANKQVVITMLPNGDALAHVYKEIVPAAAPGTCPMQARAS